jgi:peptidyl-prolyl cis-trans isomerase A (cyclophilin A)
MTVVLWLFLSSLSFAQQTQAPPIPSANSLSDTLLAQPTVPPTPHVTAATPAVGSASGTPPNSGAASPLKSPEPEPVFTKDLYATLETSKGKIKIRLYSTIVPRTVRNFVMLATGQKEFKDVKTGRMAARPFYDGLIFHKVVKGFVIQTGCPFGTGKGDPGYSIKDEFTPVLRHNKAGIVSMANAGKDTNGSQFFITLKAEPELDDKYTVFGEVIEGMDVVRNISLVPVGPTDRPLHRVYLKTVSISQ